LLNFVQDERQRIQPAADMARKAQVTSAGTFNKVGGAAAESLVSAGLSIMQRQLESDDKFIALARSRMETIRENCTNEEDTKKMADIERRLSEANAVVDQAAKEAEATAASGQFSDQNKIANLLTKVILVARANSLLGNVETGNKQTDAAIHVFKTFIKSVSQTCSDQSFRLEEVYGLERQNELLPTGVDLSACMNRLFEASGLTNELLPYRLRHCGPRLEGTWKMQVTRGQIGGAFGKLEGQTEVPGFGVAVPVQAPGSLPLSASYVESEPGLIEINGRLGDAQVTIGNMRVSGTIKIIVEIDTMKPGVEVHKETKMRVDLKQEGFNATPKSGGMTTHYPGRAGPAVDLPIKIINRNKPCDPDKDIWSYSTD
jgi:hypothetical protein